MSLQKMVTCVDAASRVVCACIVLVSFRLHCCCVRELAVVTACAMPSRKVPACFRVFKSAIGVRATTCEEVSAYFLCLLIGVPLFVICVALSVFAWAGVVRVRLVFWFSFEVIVYVVESC